MKGVEPLIAAVFIIIISITGIAIVLESSQPSVSRLQEISLLEEAKKILTQIDNAVRTVGEEGEGSTRVLQLSVSDGNYVIDTDKDVITFSMDSKSQVVGRDVTQVEGNVNIYGELNQILMNVSYSTINITGGGSFGRGIHSLIIRNDGYDVVNQKQIISISLVPPLIIPVAFMNQYNQFGDPYIAKGGVPSGYASYLNALGEGLTYDVPEAIESGGTSSYSQFQTANISGENTTSADYTASIDNNNYNVTSTVGIAGGTFTNKYNQSQTANITGNASTINQATINSYLNVNGDGLVWSVTKAVESLSTIAFDATSSMTRSTTASSISWSHTTGAGNNRLLLVTVGVHVATGTPTTVTSVTYGGTPLTQVTTALYSSTNPQVRTYVFRLINPASGANTITVNFAAATLSVAGAVTYSGVDQNSPIQTSSTSTGSGTTASSSVTVTGSGRLLFGYLGGHRTANTWTITEGTGQTNRWSQISQLYKGRGSDKSVTAGSQSMSWTFNRQASYVVSTIVINPAPFYRAEVEHNATVIYSGILNSTNVSINFTSTANDVYSMKIYDFVNSNWDASPCQSQSVVPNTYYTIWCNVTNNPQNYNSSDGIVRIRINSTSNTNKGDLKEDYVQYYISSKVLPKYANISVEHNSSTILEDTLSIKKINVTALLKTNILSGVPFVFYIYNFDSDSWEPCPPQALIDTNYKKMECVVLSNPSYYISDGKIRVRLNSSGDTTTHQMMEDYLVYQITKLNTYRVEVWHNSSQIADGNISFINATVNFTTNISDTYSLQIYDWLNSQWTSANCDSGNVLADTPTMWWCNETSNAMNYNSSDRRIRVRIGSAADADNGLLKEDYIQYFVGYAQ
jgi:hypothetical protein